MAVKASNGAGFGTMRFGYGLVKTINKILQGGYFLRVRYRAV